MVLKFETKGYNCYNLQFCPQIAHRIGCVSSQNFGIVGSGSLFIIDILGENRIVCNRVFNWKSDSLYDLCWNESQFDNILWTVSANGFIQIWDTNNQFNSEPIHTIKAHEREIYCCNWSTITYDSASVLTVSRDLSIKVWDAFSSQPINQYLGHESIVYCGQWSPIMSKTFATTSADSTLRVWSVRDLKPSLTIKASFGEVLSCDWNKFNEFIITTSDTNGLINVWDIRSPNNPLVTLFGHSKAIKKVKFSPFRESIIGSVSYDMSTRLWDTMSNTLSHTQTLSNNLLNNSLLYTSQQHTEFVYGFDFNRNIIDQMADCSWDQFIHIFSYLPNSIPINQL